MNPMLQRLSILTGLLCAGVSLVGAQSTALDEGYRQMYNLQFPEAHRTFAEWQRQHPDDPMGPVSDAAAYLFAEFDRLHILQSEFFVHDQHFVTDNKLQPDPEVKRRFEESLDKAFALYQKNPNDRNAQFANILRSGLRSDYMALIEKRYSTSLKEMKSARGAAEKLLAADPTYYDAWIAVGVENYMLSVKPAPLRWVLRMTGAQTDRTFGLEKLRLTAEKGRYLAPFARLLLAVAALRDKDVPKARGLLAGLTREFPKNPLYTQELARINTQIDSGSH
jgi:tetratricopeptide (TPR) repeat protein